MLYNKRRIFVTRGGTYRFRASRSRHTSEKKLWLLLCLTQFVVTLFSFFLCRILCGFSSFVTKFHFLGWLPSSSNTSNANFFRETFLLQARNSNLFSMSNRIPLEFFYSLIALKRTHLHSPLHFRQLLLLPLPCGLLHKRRSKRLLFHYCGA